MVRTGAYQFFQNFTFPRQEFLGKNITLYIGDKEFKGKVTKASLNRSFDYHVPVVSKLKVLTSDGLVFVIKIMKLGYLVILKNSQKVAVDRFLYEQTFYDNTE